MREFTLIEMECNEAIFSYNNPIPVAVSGVLVSEVSEQHGCYTVPAVRVVRDAEIEFSF